MKTGKIVLICIGIFVGLIALSWGMTALGILKMSIFEPARENVRRNVFENTQSYVEGKRQELTKYRLEYMKASDVQTKNAIQMTVSQSCANLDETKITDPELHRFLMCMRDGKPYSTNPY